MTLGVEVNLVAACAALLQAVFALRLLLEPRDSLVHTVDFVRGTN